MGTAADRCWCEKGEAWARKGVKSGQKGGETAERALSEPLISSQ